MADDIGRGLIKVAMPKTDAALALYGTKQAAGLNLSEAQRDQAVTDCDPEVGVLGGSYEVAP